MLSIVMNPFYGICLGGCNVEINHQRNSINEGHDFMLPNCDEIENNLYLGNAKAALDDRIITSLNITHILTVDAQPIKKSFLAKRNITYLYLEAYDDENQNILQYIGTANEFIKKGQENGTILVHCQAGISRSSSLVIAYLMHKHKIGLREAYLSVKMKRPEINPNHGFVDQLRYYEYILNGHDDEYNLLKIKSAKNRKGYTAMFIDENETAESVWVWAALGAIRAVTFVFDIVTYPIHVIIQQPWRKRQLSRRVKARIVEQTETSITIKTLEKPSSVTLRLAQAGVKDMEHMFREAASTWRNKPCFGTRKLLAEEDEVQPNGRIFKKYVLGEYEWRTYLESERESEWFGRGLREFGAKPKKNIVMFAETRAEWMLAAHGCFKHSIPVVTIYATLGDDAIAHGINETEVTTVITSHELLPKFKNILSKTPLVDTIIYFEDQLKKINRSGFKEGINIISYSDVVKAGRSSKIQSTPPKSSDTAIIMYTSGSTGVPKGVILSHGNLISTLTAFADAVPIKQDDVLIGFLPLAHVFELLCESLCITAGVPIGYSTPLTMIDSSSKIKKGCKGDASVLKPTCVTSVPLILDRICKGITEKVSKGGPFANAFFRWAYTYKERWMKRGYDTPILNYIVFNKVKSLLGGKVRVVVAGGAPLSADTHTQIRVCLCCSVVTGYGLTETTSCASVMDEHDRSTGRVGAPTTSTVLRLVDWPEAGYRVSNRPHPQGEIIIGGDSVSEGYYKMPEKTKEDFIEMDGQRWFKTGDIGEIHPDGCIKIIDRKKDLVKLQAGEYVSLGKVESELKTCPLIENICVYGDGLKNYTVALVVPVHSALKELAAKNGINEDDVDLLCKNPTIEKAFLIELQDHAKKCKLEKFEVPAAVKLCSEVWSPDMGLVTAAFKIKRKDIQERYKDDIKRMYAS